MPEASYEFLAEMAQLVAKTTPGPWTVHGAPGALAPVYGDGSHLTDHSIAFGNIERAGDENGDQTTADLVFCAAARTWLPLLVETVEKLAGFLREVAHDDHATPSTLDATLLDGYSFRSCRRCKAENLLRELKTKGLAP